MTDLRSFTARLPMTDFHFMTGLFAALSYVVFTFLQFKITLPGGDATSIHLGNAVCVLGALLSLESPSPK